MVVSRVPGRPRSKSAHEAILRAAADLVTEHGFELLTMEGIAAQAGTSKQTVYRWWKSKAAVVVEAIEHGYLSFQTPVPASTGDLRADVRRWLDQVRVITQQGDTPRLVQEILSALTSSSGESALYPVLIEPLRHALAGLFEAHEETRPGELPASAALLAEIVGGSLLLRLVFAEPTPDEWVEQLLNLVAPRTT